MILSQYRVPHNANHWTVCPLPYLSVSVVQRWLAESASSNLATEIPTWEAVVSEGTGIPLLPYISQKSFHPFPASISSHLHTTGCNYPPSWSDPEPTTEKHGTQRCLCIQEWHSIQAALLLWTETQPVVGSDNPCFWLCFYGKLSRK